jgi:predicted TIM-barrel fold metal-dependent hydrolase
MVAILYRFESQVKIEGAVAAAAGKMILMGNINTPELLLSGTPDEVAEACQYPSIVKCGSQLAARRWDDQSEEVTMNYKKAIGKITEELQTIPLLDTHEHIQPQSEIKKRDVDLFDLFSGGGYIHTDLISAGMPAEDWKREQFDPLEGWKRIRPYLPHVRTTTYFRFYLAAFRELFDFRHDEINDENWRELSEKIFVSNKREDWYRYVLKDRANLDVALLNRRLVDETDASSGLFVPLGDVEIDREFFAPVLAVDPFMFKCSRRAIEALTLPPDMKKMGIARVDILNRVQEQWGASTETLGDYLALIDSAFRRTVELGGVAVKLAAAYVRSLEFEAVTKQEAERVFHMPEEEVSPSEAKRFEDYITRVIVEKAIEYDLPIQIHTGMQAHNGNILSNSNPLLLNNLFLEYREAKFVIFHGGFPFTGEAGCLAKSFPNVYLDLCWLPILSDTAAKIALSKLIDLMPGNKLLWGGDCVRVESFYGSVLFSKKVVAQVLAQKVADGYFSPPVAIDLGRNIFRENALKLFQLDKRRQEVA